MKGNKFILLVSSILLLTISSGLLFYKELFLMESFATGGKIDFEELRYTDLQINATTALMRENLSTDQAPLNSEITRTKELINIITDVNRSSNELASSVKKIQSYFDHKIKDLNHFKLALKELKTAVDSLNPGYNELTKNNIKFSVDKRDFYRECVVDALFFVATSSNEYEQRLQEDKKILGQILSFANTPNPIILKFANNIDTVIKRTKEIEQITEGMGKEGPINNEMAIVGKYYKESQDSKAHDGQIFLTMVFGAIVLYLICIIVMLRKLT
ncbi:MAG: hypothetical protein ACXVLQ_13240 [Bacteriovorax sp.]